MFELKQDIFINKPKQNSDGGSDEALRSKEQSEIKNAETIKQKERSIEGIPLLSHGSRQTQDGRSASSA